MKLWEVLKALEENPDKKFKSVNYNQEEIIISMGADCYDLPFRVLDSNRDWQEVKQPVPWQEAIKAWMNGKTIGVTQKDIEKRFYEGKDYLLRDQHGDSVSEDEIAEGTWYIEED